MNILDSLPSEVLTEEQEAALVPAIKSGNVDAANDLALHNMAEGFRYMKRCCRAKIPDDELFSLCYRTLLRNAKRFQPGRVRFLAFAKAGMRGAISRFWRGQDVVRNSSQHETGDGVEDAEVVLLPEPGGNNVTGSGADWIHRLVTGVQFPHSTNPLSEPSEEPDFASIDIAERMIIVRDIIENQLSEQEAMILDLVYTSGYNFPEIGRFLGVTRSAVQLMHKKALQKIRDELTRSKRLLV
jgi:RNA polymerase sigma factor (sigma-70 family)